MNDNERIKMEEKERLKKKDRELRKLMGKADEMIEKFGGESWDSRKY